MRQAGCISKKKTTVEFIKELRSLDLRLFNRIDFLQEINTDCLKILVIQ